MCAEGRQAEYSILHLVLHTNLQLESGASTVLVGKLTNVACNLSAIQNKEKVPIKEPFLVPLEALTV